MSIVVLAVAGCASNVEDERVTRYGTGALIGAVAGCAIAEVADAECRDGVMVGAMVSLAVNYFNDVIIEQSARQTKSAEQMLEQVKPKYKEPLLAEYRTWADPAVKMNPGDKVTFLSMIAVGPSLDNKSIVVEEHFQLLDNHALDHVLAEKRKKINTGGEIAGEFSNQFSFVIPAGVPAGHYPVRTTLYINKVRMASRDMALEVAHTPLDNSRHTRTFADASFTYP